MIIRSSLVDAFFIILKGGAVAQAKGSGFQRLSALDKGRSPAPHAPLPLTCGYAQPRVLPAQNEAPGDIW